MSCVSLSSSSVEDNSELPLLGSCDRLKRRRMIKPFQLHDEILCFREGIKPAKNINSGGGGDWEHLLFNSSLERVTGEKWSHLFNRVIPCSDKGQQHIRRKTPPFTGWRSIRLPINVDRLFNFLINLIGAPTTIPWIARDVGDKVTRLCRASRLNWTIELLSILACVATYAGKRNLFCPISGDERLWSWLCRQNLFSLHRNWVFFYPKYIFVLFVNKCAEIRWIFLITCLWTH